MKQYIKYQEPVEKINDEIVDAIVKSGIYPRDFLLKALGDKEMNYATATYHLMLKKHELMIKFQKEEEAAILDK